MLKGGWIKWTKEEEETLMKLREGGMSWAEVGDTLSRTSDACRQCHYILVKNESDGEIIIRDKVASLYKCMKEKMWAKIAKEMEVPWTEAETNHWCLGKEWMAKRANDETFLTREERFQFMPCVGLPPAPVVEAEAQGNLEQNVNDLSRHEWSGTETNTLWECIEAELDWTEVSRRLPGRTAEDCKEYYYDELKRAGGWPPELQTELSRLYESSKMEMWTEIANELQIPWQSAERIHWTLEAEDIRI
ncbi:hypothetical protein E4U16_008220 [Claviceps sp. LM84 group G4]|nr:hypothetical protein E4U33_000603 [Claviceps sp. LM78 group G4]KAG6067230.1 hypothetical protein E4U16_008220 [Claviceps sp. LM84 group G4]